jgi:hypothetical protein
MTLLVTPVLLCVLSVPLLGGHLSALGKLRLRWTPALLGALTVQLAVLGLAPGWPDAVLAIGHMASYGLAAAFLAANRDVPWLWLIGLGGLANLAAIAANGGRMPASPAALDAAGVAPPEGFSNSAVMADAELAFLGDVFASPAGWGPLSNVFSVGDVCLVVGAALALHRICGSRLPTRRAARSG